MFIICRECNGRWEIPNAYIDHNHIVCLPCAVKFAKYDDREKLGDYPFYVYKEKK